MNRGSSIIKKQRPIAIMKTFNIYVYANELAYAERWCEILTDQTAGTKFVPRGIDSYEFKFNPCTYNELPNCEPGDTIMLFGHVDEILENSEHRRILHSHRGIKICILKRNRLAELGFISYTRSLRSFGEMFLKLACGVFIGKYLDNKILPNMEIQLSEDKEIFIEDFRNDACHDGFVDRLNAHKQVCNMVPEICNSLILYTDRDRIISSGKKLNHPEFYLLPKEIDQLKRGDLVIQASKFGYRNDGIYIFDGNKIVELANYPDEYGNIPSKFEVLSEFHPYTWVGSIEHNSYVYFNYKNNLDMIEQPLNIQKMKINDEEFQYIEVNSPKFGKWKLVCLDTERTFEEALDFTEGWFSLLPNGEGPFSIYDRDIIPGVLYFE